MRVELKKVIGKEIVVIEPSHKLYADMIGKLCSIEKAMQSECVYVKTQSIKKMLHWSTEVDCIIVAPETNPEYYL